MGFWGCSRWAEVTHESAPWLQHEAGGRGVPEEQASPPACPASSSPRASLALSSLRRCLLQPLRTSLPVSNTFSL